jgi:hypothetical protein
LTPSQSRIHVVKKNMMRLLSRGIAGRTCY